MKVVAKKPHVILGHCRVTAQALEWVDAHAVAFHASDPLAHRHARVPRGCRHHAVTTTQPPESSRHRLRDHNVARPAESGEHTRPVALYSHHERQHRRKNHQGSTQWLTMVISTRYSWTTYNQHPNCSRSLPWRAEEGQDHWHAAQGQSRTESTCQHKQREAHLSAEEETAAHGVRAPPGRAESGAPEWFFCLRACTATHAVLLFKVLDLRTWCHVSDPFALARYVLPRLRSAQCKLLTSTLVFARCTAQSNLGDEGPRVRTALYSPALATSAVSGFVEMVRVVPPPSTLAPCTMHPSHPPTPIAHPHHIHTRVLGGEGNAPVAVSGCGPGAHGHRVLVLVRVRTQATSRRSFHVTYAEQERRNRASRRDDLVRQVCVCVWAPN